MQARLPFTVLECLLLTHVFMGHANTQAFHSLAHVLNTTDTAKKLL